MHDLETPRGITKATKVLRHMEKHLKVWKSGQKVATNVDVDI